MTYTLIFHPAAEEEYIEAFEWYESEQKGLGIRFERMVEKKVKKFFHILKIMVSVREVSIDIFPYSIVYKTLKANNIIYICAVYHSSRNPKNKYRR